MEQKKKVKFLQLGTVTVAKKKNPNDPDEPRKVYMKLEQQKNKETGEAYGDQIYPITLANGTVLNDGDILAMVSKKDKFEKLVKEGKMKQEQADYLSSFLLFDVLSVQDEKSDGTSDDPF